MDDAAIKKIWNKFSPEQQNMPYTEFYREMKGLTNPIQMQVDLQDIELQKARVRTNKIRINKTLLLRK